MKASSGTPAGTIDEESIGKREDSRMEPPAPSIVSAITFPSLKKQFAKIRFTILISLGLGLTSVSTALAVSHVTGTHPTFLTADPTTAIEGAHFYYGALSTLGLLVWAGAASICLFGATFLSPIKTARRASRFLLWSGFLSLLLTLDDALLLHERLFPYGLHVPEKVVLLGYAIFFLVYVRTYAAEIIGSEYLLLVVAILSLGVSVVMDQLLPRFELRTFIEDSFKFVGIVFWLAYFAHVTRSTMRSALIQGSWHEAPTAG